MPRKRPRRCRPHYDADDKCVRALYAEHAKRSRDPSQGPTWWGIDESFVTGEYLIDDEFHRDETDGQAVITRDPEKGAVLTEVYHNMAFCIAKAARR